MGQKKQKNKKTSLKDKVLKKGKQLLGKKNEGGKRRKKSALWYAKERARLKEKKKYERERMRL